MQYIIERIESNYESIEDLMGHFAIFCENDYPKNYVIYAITEINPKTGYIRNISAEMLWLPKDQRAGIVYGGDASWTDANSPNDAVMRYFNDDMSN